MILSQLVAMFFKFAFVVVYRFKCRSFVYSAIERSDRFCIESVNQGVVPGSGNGNVGHADRRRRLFHKRRRMSRRGRRGRQLPGWRLLDRNNHSGDSPLSSC